MMAGVSRRRTYPCYALWVDRHGRKTFEGPFRDNTAAQAYLDKVIDKSGGSMLVNDNFPRTPAEHREALPIMEEGPD